MKHVSIAIDRTADDVYDYIVHPANLPAWAAGLSSGIAFTDGRWRADSPMAKS